MDKTEFQFRLTFKCEDSYGETYFSDMALYIMSRGFSFDQSLTIINDFAEVCVDENNTIKLKNLVFHESPEYWAEGLIKQTTKNK